MGGVWRVIVDDPLLGLENMARDAALLEVAEKGESAGTTLRFYRWAIPTLSLGNKQEAAKAANLDFCREKGIDIVRRPTGGGAVLHHHELTYSTVSNDRSVFPQASVKDSYVEISTALKRGLEIMGIPAEIKQYQVEETCRPENYVKNPTPCFTSTSHYELDVAGKKIVGSAQKRSKRAFLQHGSIPCNYDWALHAYSMRSDIATMKESMTCMSEHVSPLPGFREMMEAFLTGFMETFKVKAVVGSYSEEETAAARRLLDSFKVVY